MNLKSNKAKILFCGKERKFARCPNKTIKDFQEKVEKVQEDSKQLIEKQEEHNDKVAKLHKQYDRIERKIETIEDSEEPTDEELRLIRTLLDEQEQIDDDISELAEIAKGMQDELDKEGKTFSKKLDKEIANFASTILDGFKPEEYLEDADSVDNTLSIYLPEIYRMVMVGASQKEIDKKCKEIIIGDDSEFQGRRNRRNR